MSIFVKICGLRDAEHVDAAIDAGADAVGFVFAGSVRRVSPQEAVAACANVPAHIKRVAVMRHPGNAEWQAVLQVFSPEVLQTDADDFATLDVPERIERWPVFREGGIAPGEARVYIYEGPNSGRGETVDWSQAATVARDGNMILAGGLAADNVAEAITTVQPFGVDVSSAVETLPGQKDLRLISEFVTAARAVEKNL